jgi:hypothetical protein
MKRTSLKRLLNHSSFSEGNLTMGEKLRLLLEWMPVLAMLGNIVNTQAGASRVRAVLDVLDVVADKTTTTQDDQLIELLRAVVVTPQGAALVDWISDKTQAIFEDNNDDG